jgi:alpha-galactosidase
MSETIRRMVEEYGAQYIKCDYNQDCGVGTDLNAENPGAGLEEAANAFLDWMREMIAKYPDVVFEGCSSGGMRMDYQTLSAYSLLSTSDQTDYLLYPYIAGNILAAVLPEQAAVWSYPIDTGFGNPNSDFKATPEWVEVNISKEQVVVNMINSFLGRMHLASHLELLSKEKFALVEEGVAYYKTLTKAKKQAVPYMPCGFTNAGADNVVAGFKTGNKIYLAVWCLKGATDVRVPIQEGIAKVKLAYPSVSLTQFEDNGNELSVMFAKGNGEAAFFEIEVK